MPAKQDLPNEDRSPYLMSPADAMLLHYIDFTDLERITQYLHRISAFEAALFKTELTPPQIILVTEQRKARLNIWALLKNEVTPPA
ncbi:MAG: hypothetical protein R3A44_44435 [Caldilineaceae bacterium]